MAVVIGNNNNKQLNKYQINTKKKNFKLSGIC